MKKIVPAAVIIAVLVVVSLFFVFNNQAEPTGDIVAKPLAEVYMSPSCSCCGDYVRYLSENGFDVRTIRTQDTGSIKTGFGVPWSMQSCHTTRIGNYFVEGHVPLAAIQKLLNEQPEIDGIALPDMPSGSPGMPGRKTQAFVIYAVSDGGTNEFIRL